MTMNPQHAARVDRSGHMQRLAPNFALIELLGLPRVDTPIGVMMRI
jgi:hypothetical protein